MQKCYNSYKVFCLLILVIYNLTVAPGCKKMIQVSDPINTITASLAYNSDQNATSSVMAIYSNMSWGSNNVKFANSAISIYAGLSADELNAFNNSGDLGQFQTNKLLSTNAIPGATFWSPAYSYIYIANVALDGLQTSSDLSNNVKNQLIGEVKFLRAFCYFYLVNLYGDVPLVLTSDWTETSKLERASVDIVYQHIILDLLDAQRLLNTDYSYSNGEHIRANKWAATALLARVYLYSKDWKNAELQSTEVINNATANSLDSNLTDIFLKNSAEAILQLQNTNVRNYCTYEGLNFIPANATSSPKYYLSQQLLQSFEIGDKRRALWVDSTKYRGIFYYYPSKYKSKAGTATNITEYYTILRMAEQYLIRAEARAQQGGSSLLGAASDLNVIRNRSGLKNTTSTSQSDLLTDIYHERQIEFFAEWGHRWLDLKRTSQALNILGAIPSKQPWSNNQLLYPIAITELSNDPNLEQNDGY